jgi:SAM-dependent methyltransferase
VIEESEDVQRYYAHGAEAERLNYGPGKLERLRTKEILSRFLPGPPARILDIGGGAGAYSLWLLENGYEVDLIEPVPLHVEQAAATMAEAGVTAGVSRLGDARHLEDADGTADGVLFLGPLYHLIGRSDRVQSLREARRVLRPGGVLVAAVISRFASLLDGYSRQLMSDAAFVDIVKRDLREGQHRNPTDRLDYFTTAYFHHPAEVRGEVESAGLAVEAVLAVEGPFWVLGDFETLWAQPPRREQLLEYLRSIETEESLHGVSAHLLVIARAV